MSSKPISQKLLPIRGVIRQLWNTFKQTDLSILIISEENFNRFFEYCLDKLNFKEQPWEMEHILALDFFQKSWNSL